MTLGKIKVKNFQSIESAEVELGKFTVFTGPSSSGKSALLRAAEAVTRNSFTPAQVRMGAKVAEVTLEIDEHEITAKRGKSQSTYILDGEEFTKSGRNVPEAVADVLSMPEIADMESTFASQFDKPYLISETGSVASKVLGTLTNVSVLHEGLRETNRRTLESRSSLKNKTAELATVETTLEDFNTLDAKLEIAQEAQDMRREIEDLENQHTTLSRIVSHIESLVEQHKVARESWVDLSSLEDLSSDSEALISHTLTPLASVVAKLSDAHSRLPTWSFGEVPEGEWGLTELDSAIVPLQRILNHVSSITKEIPRWKYSEVPSGEDLTQDLDVVQKLQKVLKDIESRVAKFKKLQQAYTEATSKMQDIQEESDTLLSGLDECPLCNSPIGSHLD